MNLLTERKLRNLSSSTILDLSAVSHLKKHRFQSETSIFLSHSHSDKKIVEGFVNEMVSLGVDVYVDWQDPNMPDNTSRETAERIKEKIDDNDVFIMLATINACESRWVPWELGIADDRKDRNKIYIAPIADKSGRFEGSEYLQVYKHIEVDGFLKESSEYGARLKVIGPSGDFLGTLKEDFRNPS